MNPSEEELVSRAVVGDAEAITVLLERHGPAICQELKIGSKWRGVVEADDVMQVTYLEAFLRIREFDPTVPHAFGAWLRRIADNNLRDAVKEQERDKRPQNRVTLPVGEGSYVALLDRIAGTTTTPSRSAAKHEVEEIMESALRKLPPDYERVLRLYELEERPGPEVAAIMGRSHGAVKMLAARASERLHEVLGSCSKFFSDTA